MKSFLLAIALALSSVTAAFATQPTAEEIQHIASASVKLELPGQMGMIAGYCSGQIIYSAPVVKDGKSDVVTYVLTAKHCTADAATGAYVKVDIQRHDATGRQYVTEQYDAMVAGESYKSDLALLKLNDKVDVFPFTNVAPADAKLTFGQDSLMVAFPLGLGQTLTYGSLGYIEHLDGPFDELSQSHDFQRASPLMAPGSSGGALFVQVDGQWEQVGVTTGGALGFIDCFTPISEIQAYLKEALTDVKWK